MTACVLVVSPNKANFELVNEALAKHEIAVAFATGMSLALFLAQKNQPLIIICDLELADGDGIALLQELRVNSDLQAIPFIFLLSKEPSSALRSSLLNNAPNTIVSTDVKAPELLTILLPYLPKHTIAKSQREDHSSE